MAPDGAGARRLQRQWQDLPVALRGRCPTEGAAGAVQGGVAPMQGPGAGPSVLRGPCVCCSRVKLSTKEVEEKSKESPFPDTALKYEKSRRVWNKSCHLKGVFSPNT